MPQLLIRSTGQVCNIGDIAITPGMLRLVERHLPGAGIALHSPRLAESPAAQAMVARAFPRVRLVGLNRDPVTQAVPAPFAEALAAADLVLDASAPWVHFGRVAPHDWNYTMLASQFWFQAVDAGKRWGAFAQTFDGFPAPSDVVFRPLLSSARFVFARDSDSLAHLRWLGVHGPALDFVPDACFAFDLRDEAGADAIAARHGLQPGRFLAAIAHWRADRPRLEVFARTLEAWTAGTGLPVLLVPEDDRAEATHREQVLPLLSPACRALVQVLDGFWLPDAAASLYARAAAVLSMEMHSTILAIAAGTPSVHLRIFGDTPRPEPWFPGHPEAARNPGPGKVNGDGRKGEMMRDLGLGGWMHEVERDPAGRAGEALAAIHRDPAAARARVAAVQRDIAARHAAAMAVVARACI